MKPEEDVNGNIARRIRALRLSKGIKLEDLAKAVDASPHFVTRVENGTSTLSASQLVEFSGALGVVVSVVVGDIPANYEGKTGQ